MSSDEKESFEITDFDLATEFNPNRYRKMTKNQKIYGESLRVVSNELLKSADVNDFIKQIIAFFLLITLD